MLLLTFTAGPNRYAIDVTWVIELVPRVALRSVPLAPRYLSGLLDYRGSVIPIIDLGLLLGSEACRDWLNTRIILVSETRGKTSVNSQPEAPDPTAGVPSTRQGTLAVASMMGVMANEVSELAYVQPGDLHPAPVQLREAPFLSDVVKTEHGIVQMIDVTKLKTAVQI
jgi:chemotaxis-related protein WspB